MHGAPADILNLLCHDVIKEGIAGKISSHHIIANTPDLHEWNAAVNGVHFGAQIGDVNGETMEDECGSIEMFGLRWVGFDHGDCGNEWLLR